MTEASIVLCCVMFVLRSVALGNASPVLHRRVLGVVLRDLCAGSDLLQSQHDRLSNDRIHPAQLLYVISR